MEGLLEAEQTCALLDSKTPQAPTFAETSAADGDGVDSPTILDRKAATEIPVNLNDQISTPLLGGAAQNFASVSAESAGNDQKMSLQNGRVVVKASTLIDDTPATGSDTTSRVKSSHVSGWAGDTAGAQSTGVDLSVDSTKDSFPLSCQAVHGSLKTEASPGSSESGTSRGERSNCAESESDDLFLRLEDITQDGSTTDEEQLSPGAPSPWDGGGGSGCLSPAHGSDDVSFHPRVLKTFKLDPPAFTSEQQQESIRRCRQQQLKRYNAIAAMELDEAERATRSSAINFCDSPVQISRV